MYEFQKLSKYSLNKREKTKTRKQNALTIQYEIFFNITLHN